MKTVTIDSREKTRIELAKNYYSELGYQVKISQEATGDYIFQDKVVFEFKTWQDLIGSINNNRVFNEAITQTEHYPYHFVIIQGTNRDYLQAFNEANDYGTITHEQITGALARLYTYTKVVRSTRTLDDAFYEMHKISEKILDNKTIVKDFGTKSINPAFNCLAYCVDNIKGERAKNIVNTLKLKTIKDVCSLTHEDLVKVPGIGDKLAEQILEAIK